MKILQGHTSQETAYVVEDYPYGFRLRCKIRYWLEYKKGHGYRMMSQTTNPKRPGEVWNNPKGSTYQPFAVMVLDEEEHVTHIGLQQYEGPDRIIPFFDNYFTALNEEQQKRIATLISIGIIYNKNSWIRWVTTEGEKALRIPESARAVLYRVILGVSKDECPSETALAKLPEVLRKLGKAKPVSHDRNHFHLFGYAVPKIGGKMVCIEGHEAEWSGSSNHPPSIGKRVTCKGVNDGKGTVVSYFIEAGYLGVAVLLDVQHPNLTDEEPFLMAFGSEIEEIQNPVATT